MLMPLQCADETIDLKPKSIALFECPPLVVTEIILGARIDLGAQQAILSALQREHACPPSSGTIMSYVRRIEEVGHDERDAQQLVA